MLYRFLQSTVLFELLNRPKHCYFNSIPALITNGAFADSKAPLAGFSTIEAADMDEVIRFVREDALCACEGSDRTKVDHGD
jgi:hypothetical protein